MIDPGLDGRVALVTGANQGIGAATALARSTRQATIGSSPWTPARWRC